MLLLASLIASSPVHAQRYTDYELSPADRTRLDVLGREQAREDAKAIAELKALRDKLLRLPPRAPERNRLLGQWKVENRARKKGEMAQMFDMLANIERAKCEFLFGAGSVTEFRPKDWASIDGCGNDTLGSVAYRSDGKTVWMIPEKSISTGMMFFAFDFVNESRVNVVTPTVNEDCTLNRVSSSTQAAQGGAVTRAPAAQGGSGSHARAIERSGRATDADGECRAGTDARNAGTPDAGSLRPDATRQARHGRRQLGAAVGPTGATRKRSKARCRTRRTCASMRVAAAATIRA